ncbi:MAG TPA: zinc ribbon domain-containing protein, partial [Thermoplasmata archaeon]|nr:zinc ribbon domain-containing protein [Thermoplasmata archaeon]
ILNALRAASLAPRASPSRWALRGRSGAGAFVAGFELLGPISWRQKGFESGGAPQPGARGGGAPAGRPPYTVSEGAYVPRATYRATRPTRWRLAAAHCGHCDGWSFPAAPSCRHCGRSDRLEGRELAREGLRVEAATTVVPGAQPTEFDAQVARTGAIEVVLARTLQGPLVTLQVTDAPAGSVAVGERVDAVLRRLYPMEGEWRYGLKAVPAGAPPPEPDPATG